ncbi:MAG: DUF5317 family protein [Anaerolineales bacterium]
MILLVAVVAGMLVGLGWAANQKIKYEAPVLHHLWLIPAAFFLQKFAHPTDVFLPISQILFIGFAFLNRHSVGIKILMFGAVLNFLVMISNGGFMPISPETANRVVSSEVFLDFQSGTRFGVKDILLLPEQTHFEWLADRFLPPIWSPYQVAFSLGDMFIAAGAFWMLAKPQKIEKVISI